MKNSTIMNTQKHSSRRGLRRGRGVLYICRQKSQFADYRYKFSRNMCPRRPRGSEIFLDERCRKCPSDNVNNFVEIEKFSIFGKNYHMSEAAGKFVVAVQRNCWRTRYFTKNRKFEKTTRVEFQLMILHF